MKKILLLFCFAICASLSYGQLKIIQNGYVGINNPNPQQILHIKNLNGSAWLETTAVNGNSKFAFRDPTGTVGTIGFTNPFPHFFVSQQRATSDIIFQIGTSNVLRVKPNGNTAITGDVTASGVLLTSDRRTKSNIKDFDSSIETVMALNPVTYDYNGTAGTVNNRNHIGLVAQELQKVAPTMVSEFEHTNDEFSDAPGKTEKFLQIHDSEIKYLLVNAIQDQQKMIADQADRIAELEEAISGLGTAGSSNNTSVTLENIDLAKLDQNVPNPFSSTTNISYAIPTDANNAEVRVFSQAGQLMKTVKIDHVGNGTLTVDASNLASGTYTYQLIVDGRNIDANTMVVTQ